MCGIIGYTGPLEADNILLNGLAGLEYRGYDSAGIAYFGNDSKIHLIKTVGKVAANTSMVITIQTPLVKLQKVSVPSSTVVRY